MELELEFGGALCYCPKFNINGVRADSRDFGDQYDASPETAEDYGCGNMVFYPKLPTQSTLDKYDITVDEYAAIASQLETGLSFGSCCWCV